MTPAVGPCALLAEFVSVAAVPGEDPVRFMERMVHLACLCGRGVAAIEGGQVPPTIAQIVLPPEELRLVAQGLPVHVQQAIGRWRPGEPADVEAQLDAPKAPHLAQGLTELRSHPITMLGLLRICVFLLGLSGARAQVALTQSSPEVKKPGESTKLTCAVSGFDLSSYTMYWVRQAPGKGLEWLLYYYSSSSNSYSPTIQGRFTASKDSSNFYLHMTSLRAEDTAVYYCARDTAPGSSCSYCSK
ncbi:uncharacterized protein LOC128846247 [Malaclemys terrapin pileata]|uniref:uncharacterized protein LOC128846247 n=1 Tax=Malaclemys terrapin pileata TaxID=2991368 RepID=UPI0023A844A0|nr:uncharacterized protein LOC128846247 [Malaclemys terrapin pileata]